MLSLLHYFNVQLRIHIDKPQEIHEVAIQALAEVTARSIEVFHKVGQLLLLEKNAPLTSYKTKANGLAR